MCCGWPQRFTDAVPVRVAASAFQLDRAAFENCTSGTRVTMNLPVGFSVDPAGGYSVGLDVNITNARGTCRYSGSLLGSGEFSAANVGDSRFSWPLRPGAIAESVR